MLEVLLKTAVNLYETMNSDLSKLRNELKFDTEKDYLYYLERIDKLKVVHNNMSYLINSELENIKKRAFRHAAMFSK